MSDDALRVLVDLRDLTIQKIRIGFGNRIMAIEGGRDQADEATIDILDRYNYLFSELEDELNKDISKLVAKYPIINKMMEVRGIGPTLAAKLVSLIDIRKADSVSALWRYCGYGVQDGKRERLVKGERAHFNQRAKTACYLIGSSFLKSRSPYRRVYDDARQYYEANRKDWTKAHIHNAALRKMVKVFLAHLWNEWRILEGLPTKPLYVNEKLGHTTEFLPEEFGWKTDEAVLETV
ncbi:hypothetical protein ADN00_15585 [Ornatilinea apprima]|uniref:Transposase n=1 Tax=Ornatilinea apprima TaxID=1134406 RepID=A0A0P6XBU1_9CHLR|nr:hypothetical protein [Ornatilinea apprima]KPL72238.1 hypothetical protein ADN00_15585 [Ornatilinea apprima]